MHLLFLLTLKFAQDRNCSCTVMLLVICVNVTYQYNTQNISRWPVNICRHFEFEKYFCY